MLRDRAAFRRPEVLALFLDALRRARRGFVEEVGEQHDLALARGHLAFLQQNVRIVDRFRRAHVGGGEHERDLLHVQPVVFAQHDQVEVRAFRHLFDRIRHVAVHVHRTTVGPQQRHVAALFVRVTDFRQIDRHPLLFVLEQRALRAERVQHRIEPRVLHEIRFAIEAVVADAEAREDRELSLEAQLGHRIKLLLDLPVAPLDARQQFEPRLGERGVAFGPRVGLGVNVEHLVERHRPGVVAREHQQRDLAADVVDVVVDLDLVALEAEQADQAVADHRVARAADVRARVRVDARVLDKRPPAHTGPVRPEPPSLRENARGDPAPKHVAIQPEVDVRPGERHAHDVRPERDLFPNAFGELRRRNAQLLGRVERP